MTAGLIAALPLYAEIDNLRESQRQDLRIRIKYPDQNVHFVVPRMRDLRRVMTENGAEGKDHTPCETKKNKSNNSSNFVFFSPENNWKLRTTLLLSHCVWTEASQIDISLCLSVRPGHELELCRPTKVLFAPKPVKRGI